jgi:hypothetical protein
VDDDNTNNRIPDCKVREMALMAREWSDHVLRLGKM